MRNGDESYLWDGSQPGWKVVESRDFTLRVELGTKLGELGATRQNALHDALGTACYNSLSSFQASVSLGYRDDAAAARVATALRAAGFAARVVEVSSYAIVRDTGDGRPLLLLVEDDEHRTRLARRMIAAGVPVENAE
jgi:hypothetical protein